MRLGLSRSTNKAVSALRSGSRGSEGRAEYGLRAKISYQRNNAREHAGQTVFSAIAVCIAIGAICRVHSAAFGKCHLDGHR